MNWDQIKGQWREVGGKGGERKGRFDKGGLEVYLAEGGEAKGQDQGG